ncbi:hypothetical protein D3C80_2221880 [compost metagenome]|jgi:hypothetical protein
MQSAYGAATYSFTLGPSLPMHESPRHGLDAIRTPLCKAGVNPIPVTEPTPEIRLF